VVTHVELPERSLTKGEESNQAPEIRRGPSFLGVCRRVLRDHPTAEDAVQDISFAPAIEVGSSRRSAVWFVKLLAGPRRAAPRPRHGAPDQQVRATARFSPHIC